MTHLLAVDWVSWGTGLGLLALGIVLLVIGKAETKPFTRRVVSVVVALGAALLANGLLTDVFKLEGKWLGLQISTFGATGIFILVLLILLNSGVGGAGGGGPPGGAPPGGGL